MGKTYNLATKKAKRFPWLPFFVFCSVTFTLIAYFDRSIAARQALKSAFKSVPWPEWGWRGKNFVDKKGVVKTDTVISLRSDEGFTGVVTIAAGTHVFCFDVDQEGIYVRVNSGLFKGCQGIVDPAEFTPDPAPQ